MPLTTMQLNIEQAMDEDVSVQKARVINIQTPDGENMYHITMREDGSLEVRTGGFIKIEGRVKDNRLMVQPEATNSILIARPDYDSES